MGVRSVAYRVARIIVFAVGAAAVLLVGGYFLARPIWEPLYQKFRGQRTVAEAVAEYEPRVRPVWRQRFEYLHADYPPQSLTFIALKKERALEVWINTNGRSVKVADYSILAASGNLGPKLRQGDRQVPEGIYTLEGLNPNSHYHASMKVGYPNAYDRQRASEEHRTSLGGDIFIHGKSASIGCLAIGDLAIEELFVLAADTGYQNVRVVIAPCDLRADCGDLPQQPPWTSDLYAQIHSELAKYGHAAQ